ncbi:PREDICTED: vacuolar protein sorting-associated protein 13-like protein [Camelina sativa]|uniref:Vacuolar protein sorting-associated protein 13-like protein n=1 Tax=Camelina sativa TaxID=90675 RepID=A0ABM0T278_CAMSA|nr:PREDICTED: vacuolar protein sorting-associated protein 13-like protein [Camelina sativa]
MESLKQASSSSGFCYHQGFSGVLQVFVHNARNIHNICIYDNQDVYAKFSLTYNPDDTISTRIIHRAGKNPEFNQKLMIDMTQIDAHAAVLKCEIWMMSRARHYMEDQLLGFALVPISDIIGQDSLTQDYSLSSTDLFHSPAGTVKLTLSIVNPSSSSSSNLKINTTSISSEVVLLDPQVSETVDYTRIEFPDINVVNENKLMVTEYFNGPGSASFLCLGSTHGPETDITMVCSEEKEVYGGNGSFMASSSTTTSLSDEKNTADSNEKENQEITEVSRRRRSNKEGEEEGKEETKMNEETTMQKQIAEMYMRSMQQFTESLAKMKLPMDLHNTPHEDDHNTNNNTTTQNQNRNNNAPNNNGMDKKKEGSRVFYGSRAFF